MVGFAYDGFSTLFTSKSIFDPQLGTTFEETDTGQPQLTEDVFLFEDEMGGNSKRYQVQLAEVNEVVTPDPSEWYTGYGQISNDLIRALDISILQFARWQQIEVNALLRSLAH